MIAALALGGVVALVVYVMLLDRHVFRLENRVTALEIKARRNVVASLEDRDVLNIKGL